MSRLRGVAVVLVGTMLSAHRGSAQAPDRCREYLRLGEPADRRAELSAQSAPVLGRLLTGVVRRVEAPEGLGIITGHASAAALVADSVVSLISQVGAADVAIALTGYMRGPAFGIGREQSLVAGALIHALNLPYDEPRRLMIDPRTDATARLAGLLAIGDTIRNQPQAQAVIASLCLLSWRSAGVGSHFGDVPLTTSLPSLEHHIPSLTFQESELLQRILTLIAASGVRVLGVAGLHEVLGETPVSRAIRSRRVELW